MQEFVGLFVFLILAISLSAAVFALGHIKCRKLSSEREDAVKEQEQNVFSGLKKRNDVRFIMYAVLFLVFSTEAILLFPAALSYGKQGLYALVEILIFSAILLAGLIYALRKNILRWK